MSNFDKWKRECFPNTKAKDAWNYQQQKIDAVSKFINGYNSTDIENDVVLRDCINEIKELLK